MFFHGDIVESIDERSFERERVRNFCCSIFRDQKRSLKEAKSDPGNMGVQLSWESTCPASRGSWVRTPSSPPIFPQGRLPFHFSLFTLHFSQEERNGEGSERKGSMMEESEPMSKTVCSSGGQSARLISARSMVRVHPDRPAERSSAREEGKGKSEKVRKKNAVRFSTSTFHSSLFTLHCPRGLTFIENRIREKK